MGSVTALPGARELLTALTDAGVQWAIATSGYASHCAARARAPRAARGHPDGDQGPGPDAKPDPTRSWPPPPCSGRAPARDGGRRQRLGPARRAASRPGIGRQSGGYGREELERADAYRVYADPAEMLSRLYEVGVRLGENSARRPAPRFAAPANEFDDGKLAFALTRPWGDYR